MQSYPTAGAPFGGAGGQPCLGGSGEGPLALQASLRQHRHPRPLSPVDSFLPFLQCWGSLQAKVFHFLPFTLHVPLGLRKLIHP